MKNGTDNFPGPADRDLDARLARALAKLPDAAVPSNFTARVLDAVEAEERRGNQSGRQWGWRRLFPRIAVAAAVLVFAGVSIQRYEIHSQRLELAKNLAAVAGSQPLPSVDALENLDAIQRMGQAAPADTELLAALQ